MTETFVGIQIGAISFVDEGVEQVLDILQEKAGVNALLISALSWSIGNAGRAAFGFPDHGVQEPDNLSGGAFFEPDPRYYNKTFMSDFPRQMSYTLASIRWRMSFQRRVGAA